MATDNKGNFRYAEPEPAPEEKQEPETVAEVKPVKNPKPLPFRDYTYKKTKKERG